MRAVSPITTDAGAVEIYEIEVEVIFSWHGEHIAHGEVTVKDPGIVDPASEPPETAEKLLLIDLRELPHLRVFVEPTEKLPDLDGAHQESRDEKGWSFDFVRLHPQHRFGCCEAHPHELLSHSPAPLRLAPPEPALDPFFQSLVFELLDDHRITACRRLHLGGVNKISPPVNGLHRRRRIDQPYNFIDNVRRPVGPRHLAVESPTLKGLEC